MYSFQSGYPSPQHKKAAERIVDLFSKESHVQAVLLTCSCARGKASRDSCLDIAILTKPEIPPAEQNHLEQMWESAYRMDPVFQDLQQVGSYSHVDLELVNGLFQPGRHDWTSGPDEFEVSIGNLLAYSIPLFEPGDYYRRLKQQWLPYYGEELRQERLKRINRFCRNNLDHIPGYAARSLYFQSFHRLWLAFGEFLQALFISRRVYPIAYSKWIREQIVEILGLPRLYDALPKLFEIQKFESGEIVEKAETLGMLLREYIPESAPGG
jgi:predicted nucleotidyltransferase